MATRWSCGSPLPRRSPQKGVTWRASCSASSRTRRAPARQSAHAVAQEQAGVVLERAEQLQRDRRGELGSGEDPQRLGVGGVPVEVPARQQGREREEQLVHEARRPSSWAFRCGPPSHSSVRTPKRSRSSASAAGRSSCPSRAARARSRPRQPRRSRAGSHADGVRITTCAACSASSGMLAVKREAGGDDARERLLAQAPRDPRRRRDGVGDDPPVALDAHGGRPGHDGVHDRCAGRGTAPGRRGSRVGPERPPSVARPSTVLTMFSTT